MCIRWKEAKEINLETFIGHSLKIFVFKMCNRMCFWLENMLSDV